MKLTPESKAKITAEIKAKKEAKEKVIKQIMSNMAFEKEFNKQIAIAQIPFLEKSITEFERRMKMPGADLNDLKHKKEKFMLKLSRIKKLLTIALLFCWSLSAAQPDIGVDSINIAKTLRLHVFTPSASQLYCPYDLDMIHPGVNTTLTWTLDIWNLGNMNMPFGCGDGSIPGITYDSCRGYNKYEGFCKFSVTDAFCNVLAETEKAYYAIATSQHYLATGAPWFAERLAWLQRMCNCTLDVVWFNSLPDSSNGTTLCPVLGPGYMDRYATAQFGNWLNIEAAIPLFVIGQTYYFEAKLYPYSIMGIVEGTVFKNSSGRIPFRWNGLAALNPIEVPSVAPQAADCCVDPLPAAPDKVTIKQGNVLSWKPVVGAEEYYIYRRKAYEVRGKICETCWHSWEAMDEIEGTSYTVPSPPSGIWQYGVSSENCAGESEITISRKDQ